VKFETFL